MRIFKTGVKRFLKGWRRVCDVLLGVIGFRDRLKSGGMLSCLPPL